MSALVQQVAVATPSNGTATKTVTISAPAAGNTLVLLVGTDTSTQTISSVSGGGVTWTKQKQSSANANVEIWTGPNSSGSGTTLSVVVSNSFAVYNLWALEFSSMPTTATLDGSNTSSGATGGTGVFASGSITPTSGDLLVAVAIGTVRAGATLGAPTGGFTALATGTTTNVSAAAYQIISSASGSYSTSWTGHTFSTYDGAIVGLLGSSGGGSAWPFASTGILGVEGVEIAA